MLLHQTTSASDTTELIRAVGGSVTFQSHDMTDGNSFWNFGTEPIVAMPFKDPSKPVYSNEKFKKRFTVSEKGRALTISQLTLQDAGKYSAKINGKTSTFTLQVYSVPGVRTELLVPLVALIVIVIIIIMAIVTFRATHSAKRCQVPTQVTPDGATCATIYAQVQKPKGTVPNPTPVYCTTIYAAATGPPLAATDGAPRSPASSPTPRGHPQDTTTVYASVTLPVA